MRISTSPVAIALALLLIVGCRVSSKGATDSPVSNNSQPKIDEIKSVPQERPTVSGEEDATYRWIDSRFMANFPKTLDGVNSWLNVGGANRLFFEVVLWPCDSIHCKEEGLEDRYAGHVGFVSTLDGTWVEVSLFTVVHADSILYISNWETNSEYELLKCPGGIRQKDIKIEFDENGAIADVCGEKVSLEYWIGRESAQIRLAENLIAATNEEIGLKNCVLRLGFSESTLSRDLACNEFIARNVQPILQCGKTFLRKKHNGGFTVLQHEDFTSNPKKYEHPCLPVVPVLLK